MRTTLDIHDPLLIRAKKVAAEGHRTLTSVVEEALRVSLDSGGKRAKPKAFRLHTVGGGRRVAGLNLDCIGAVMTQLDSKVDSPRR